MAADGHRLQTLKGNLDPSNSVKSFLCFHLLTNHRSSIYFIEVLVDSTNKPGLLILLNLPLKGVLGIKL
ncbi:hypothetical protein BDE02_18G030500 [Populus trichocarpa]|nr:hypothetical protein BDE02_18G030500 [Populus trichocarpa]